jgi:hypothetical protein
MASAAFLYLSAVSPSSAAFWGSELCLDYRISSYRTKYLDIVKI